jgi:hypothetical protein
VHFHEVENRLLEVVEHANQHCMEVVGHRKVADDTANMSIYGISLVNIARREFGIGCLGVGIAERSI